MANPALFSIPDFPKFQHYKKRRPPWVKLYGSILDDYDYGQLSDAAAALLPRLWCIASEESTDGCYHNDIKALAWRLRWNIDKTTSSLQELGNTKFLNLDSKMLAGCKQDATPEGETETKKETETETETPSSHLGPCDTDADCFQEDGIFVVVSKKFHSTSAGGETKEDAKKELKKAERNVIAVLFEDFWKAWPRRLNRNTGKFIKVGKAEAKKGFNRVVKNDSIHAKVMKAEGNYAQECDHPKDAHRFFKADMWKEWINPDIVDGGGGNDAGKAGRFDLTGLNEDELQVLWEEGQRNPKADLSCEQIEREYERRGSHPRGYDGSARANS